MTRNSFRELATQAVVLSSSGLFLAWYVWVKLAVWPWGAWTF